MTGVQTCALPISIYVSETMVGHKLGEFASTRTFRSHSRAEKATEAK